MYTRCPECDSSHVVNASLLAQSHGRVRCGRCGKKFDALEQLFDEWPALEDMPPPGGTRYRPPVLGSASDLSAPFGPAYVHHPSAEPSSGWWKGAFVMMLLVTAANLAWTFRAELHSIPQLNAVMTEFNWVSPPEERAFGDLAQIYVISRDLHSHPTRAGVLILSTTFVSHSDRAQSWPLLELTLLDLDGKAVAVRRLNVAEYLPGRGAEGDLLRPGVHVPVLLEFANPGNEATGFEIQFH